jgi:hypothetical protein
MEPANATVPEFTLRSLPKSNAAASAVGAGLITWEQAAHWYQR